MNITTFAELEEMIDQFVDIIDEDRYECEKYLQDRNAVTNTDYQDELEIEADCVASTIQKLISKLN